MQNTLLFLESVSEWAGKIVRWLILPLVLIIVLEVVLRYVFNAPTLWAWDVNVQLQAALVALGGAYALRYRSHVCVDIIVSRLSPRKRAVIDVIIWPVLLAAIGLLIWRLVPYTWNSIRITEAHTSAWAPPVYPLKVVISIGVILMLLQGITNWVRNLITAMKREGITG